MKARIIVTLKPGVLDPQGRAIEAALGRLGITGIAAVRQGKVFDVELDIEDPTQAKVTLTQASEQLLANLIIENYHIEFGR